MSSKGSRQLPASPVRLVPPSRSWSTGTVFAVYALLFSVTTFLCVVGYNVVVFRDVVLQEAREYELRQEFVQIPNVDKYHFVAHEIKESRRMVDSGLWTSSFRRWWEQSGIYKLATIESTYLKVTLCIGVIVAIIAGIYMFFWYMSNKYWMDQAIGMQQKKLDMMMGASGGFDARPTVASSSSSSSKKGSRSVKVERCDDDED